MGSDTASADGFIRDRSASLTTMSAILLPVGLILGSLAIDSGALYTQRRHVQELADLAAITASANLGRAGTAAAVSLRDNGIANVTITPAGSDAQPGTSDDVVAAVVTGRYRDDLDTEVAKRFEPGASPANAAQVMLRARGTRLFTWPLVPEPLMAAKSLARITSSAAFSVGSRLAELDGGIANALIGGLLGGKVSLSIMDYRALLGAQVDLFGFLDTLATKLSIKGGSYDELLLAKVKVGDVATALADTPGLDSRARLAFQSLGAKTDQKLEVPLASVLDLGSAGYLNLGSRPAGAAISASALQMLTASAALADGRHQAQVDLGTAIPGIASATLTFAIGEPMQSTPWFAIGEAGALARTAQTRLLLTVSLTPVGSLLPVAVNLPIYVEIAPAQAKLTDVSCVPYTPASTRVTIETTTGVADLRIAGLDETTLGNFRSAPSFGPATLLAAPLISVSGSSRVQVGSTVTPLTFNASDIAHATIKTASTSGLTGSLSQSLIGNLDLTVRIIGVDLGLSSLVRRDLTATLAKATPSVDTLLDGTLEMLGIHVGQADVRVDGTSCGRAVLVQ